MRHPGYLGWYLWAVGTQVLLLNPVSTLLFAVVVRQTDPSVYRIQSTPHFMIVPPFRQRCYSHFGGINIRAEGGIGHRRSPQGLGPSYGLSDAHTGLAVYQRVSALPPVAVCVMPVQAWRFFSHRIRYEEYYLRRIFPEYGAYAARTPTWIPFIK